MAASLRPHYEGFSRSLAREVGKAGITVKLCAPGYIANRHGPAV